MGRWTGEHRGQFAAGCLPRSTVCRCPVAYTYSNRNNNGHCYRHTYSYGDSNGDCYCSSERNSDSYGDRNCYANADTNANRVDCAGLLGTWETESGFDVERRDFESGRCLPQRRADRYDQERRFLHR